MVWGSAAYRLASRANRQLRIVGGCLNHSCIWQLYCRILLVMRIVPRLQKDAIALYHALNELIRIYQFRDRDRICCHDISITQCHGLEGLVHHGPLMLNELADYLHLDKSTTSRVVDSLERKGYATRLVHPDDSRALMLKATPAGLRLHRLIMDEIVEEEEDVLSDLSAEVRRALPGVLRKLAEAAANRSKRSNSACSPASGENQALGEKK
jgi:MarR family 2-MHQ and catechol resistance regulon transcriptional repressor